MAVFAAGYAKSTSHDGYWREARADVGQKEFRDFTSFVDSFYGKDKVKKLFENNKNTDKGIVARLNTWWDKYERVKEAEKKKTESKPTYSNGK
jgi:hypothetical protein